MSSDTSLPIQQNVPTPSSASASSPSSLAPGASSSSANTPTPTGPPATPAPSRNPSLFPGSDAYNQHQRQHDTFANADYINALAAAAQASLQSAPSSPGGDLPISRSGGGSGGSGSDSSGSGGRRNSGYAVRGHHQHHQQREDGDAMEGVVEEEGEGSDDGDDGRRGGMFNTTSFLDVDSSTPVTTPGSAHDYDYDDDGGGGGGGGGDLPPEDGIGAVTAAAAAPAGGPVHAGDAMEADYGEDDEEGRRSEERRGYGGFMDPLARARAGVSVAKGEGFVERASVMLDREAAASGQHVPGNESWNEQERVWKGGPVQGFESTQDGKGLG